MLMGLGTASAYGSWIHLNRQLTEIMVDPRRQDLGHYLVAFTGKNGSNEDR